MPPKDDFKMVNIGKIILCRHYVRDWGVCKSCVLLPLHSNQKKKKKIFKSMIIYVVLFWRLSASLNKQQKHFAKSPIKINEKQC